MTGGYRRTGAAGRALLPPRSMTTTPGAPEASGHYGPASDAWRQVWLMPRVLRDVSARSTPACACPAAETVAADPGRGGTHRVPGPGPPRRRAGHRPRRRRPGALSIVSTRCSRASRTSAKAVADERGHLVVPGLRDARPGSHRAPGRPGGRGGRPGAGTHRGHPGGRPQAARPPRRRGQRGRLPRQHRAAGRPDRDRQAADRDVRATSAGSLGWRRAGAGQGGAAGRRRARLPGGGRGRGHRVQPRRAPARPGACPPALALPAVWPPRRGRAGVRGRRGAHR